MSVEQTSMNQLITDNIDIWTSTIKAKSASGRGSSKKRELYGVKKLRELILELAVRGKLVPQDPTDEPASILLEGIAKEKSQLVTEKILKKTKKLPEISEDEKPFDLPRGWIFVRWNDVALKIGDIDHKMPSEEIDGIPYVSPRDFYPNNEIRFDSAKKISRADFEKLAAKIQPQKGDIIFPRYGTIGANVLVETDMDFLASYSCCIIKTIHKCISAKYQFYYSISGIVTEQCRKMVKKTTQPNVGIKSIQEFVVPLPPLDEQHRIVAKVDELMALCDQLEQQTEASIAAHQVLVTTLLDTLTNSADADELMQNWARISEHFDTLFTTEVSIDQLKQTILQLAVMGKLVPQDPNDEPAAKLLERIAEEKAQLIKDKKIKKQKALPPITDDEKPFELPNGWEWCRGEEVADFIDPQPSHRTPPKVEGGVPYIGYTDIDHNSGIDFNNARKVGGNVLEEHRERYRLSIGDFVFGKIGTLGKPFFLTEPFDYCLSANLILIQPKNKYVTPKFLALYLNSPALYQVLGEQKTNSTHGVFGIKKARLLLIPLPPIKEQDLIVAKIEELETICEQLKIRLIDSHVTKAKLTDAIVEKAV
ncbi:restriction endonuclease subunit S [Vibrio crassostreae]|uniref:restriction endonuclease subunit S n=1 Tax=Vibrio crassostreae TaxID=246167 RepID=UPI00104D3BB2|nr:restriction endonuclease subunit S [Vibrio crassostreae]TCO00828.1 type I restriction enzyme S subunit [Vibrio crassostreae]CAK2008111.1 Type I restriction enzyme EcoAI specificity subunit [Vibrio crassostreae]CAK2009978.1 Type I restriction enzyme EcoAI specificity subunit [Vibrio crassostreae]CAK2017517.1 Type I restriction enzyme EcoAI specificity subunit [Vibrio crassostreae]CAK2800235.1 Type I restriction enzyme EcoAI specificity subunit [Vibrio crassostreae]